MRVLALVPIVLGLALVTPLLAQEKPAKPARKVVEWAPAWKVGDWWMVKTFQKDLKDRLRSPKALKKGGGGEPRLAKDPRSAPLPTFPPLRNGVPVGYKAGNVFRFDVLRKETVKYDDGPPLDTPPEEFWVVSMKTTQGKPVRAAELWYSVEDLVLSKVVFKGQPPKKKDKEVWLNGSVQLAIPASARLGFPVDWPDLKAARKRRRRFRIADRPSVEQRVRSEKKGTDKERHWVLLQHVTKKRGQPRARGLFLFEPNKPFWSRVEVGLFMAELGEHGRKKG